MIFTLILESFAMICFASNTSVVLSHSSGKLTFTGYPMGDQERQLFLACQQFHNNEFTANIDIGDVTFSASQPIIFKVDQTISFELSCTTPSSETDLSKRCDKVAENYSAAYMNFQFLLLEVTFNGVISDFDIEYYNRLALFNEVTLSYEILPEPKLIIRHTGNKELVSSLFNENVTGNLYLNKLLMLSFFLSDPEDLFDADGLSINCSAVQSSVEFFNKFTCSGLVTQLLDEDFVSIFETIKMPFVVTEEQRNSSTEQIRENITKLYDLESYVNVQLFQIVTNCYDEILTKVSRDGIYTKAAKKECVLPEYDKLVLGFSFSENIDYSAGNERISIEILELIDGEFIHFCNNTGLTPPCNNATTCNYVACRAQMDKILKFKSNYSTTVFMKYYLKDSLVLKQSYKAVSLPSCFLNGSVFKEQDGFRLNLFKESDNCLAAPEKLTVVLNLNLSNGTNVKKSIESLFPASDNSYYFPFDVQDERNIDNFGQLYSLYFTYPGDAVVLFMLDDQVNFTFSIWTIVITVLYFLAVVVFVIVYLKCQQKKQTK